MTKRELPHVYVLELTCDGCDRPELVITARNDTEALQEAGALGWTQMTTSAGCFAFCPSCSAWPQ